jgi:hypothetical protein
MHVQHCGVHLGEPTRVEIEEARQQTARGGIAVGRSGPLQARWTTCDVAIVERQKLPADTTGTG